MEMNGFAHFLIEIYFKNIMNFIYILKISIILNSINFIRFQNI